MVVLLRWIVIMVTGTLFVLGCGETDADDDDDDVSDDDTSACSEDDTDGDGLDGCTEEALGTDPDSADTDGDGLTDAEEVDCVSDPLDSDEVCYACGWAHNDPGDLASDGADVGDVIANIPLIDQCEEDVQLWDFAQEYHILFVTAQW